MSRTLTPGHLAGRLLVEVGPGDPACRDEYFAPVHTTAGVGSGIDVVRNGYPLPVPERSVVTGPFRPFPRSVLHGEPSLFPKPPWFSGSWSVTQTGRRLTRYAAFHA